MAVVPASQAIRRSITAAINGRRGSGKSHFAIEFSPRPVLVQPLDPTLKFMIDKFNLDNVFMADYPRLSKDLLLAVSGIKSKAKMDESAGAFAKMQAEAEAVWEQFSTDFYTGLDKYRTIVWDTGSEAWELVRLARHGRLTQIEPYNYTALNTEFREMIRAAQDAGVNHIILQKMKPVWGEQVSATGKVSRGPTGEWEPSGFSHLAYEVTFEGEVYRSLCTHEHPGPCLNGNCAYKCDPACGADGLFHLKVLKCTQRSDLVFKDYPNPNFMELALEIYPNTAPEDWI